MPQVTKLFITLTCMLCLPVLTSVFAGDAAGDPVRKVFIEQPVDLPDKSFITKVRSMTWPVGYKSKEHTHAGPGPRYVVSGTVEITENGVAKQYSAGEVFWHAGGIPHTAENVDTIDTEVLIIEMLPNK